MMLFQAHRGVSTEFPENTMPAFLAAQEQGYQVIELDPAFTADGQCVVFHDATINRTCRTQAGEVITDPRKVSELTYGELLAHDAGCYKGSQFAGTQVPLLSEVLSFAGQAGLLVKLDNKFENFDPRQQEAFFNVVQASNTQVAFTCQHMKTIQQVASRFPTAEIHYDGFVDEQSVLAIKSLLIQNPLTVWLALPSRLTSWVKVPTATPSLCETVKRHARLGLWILETEEQLNEAIALGADIIETTGSVKPR